MRNLVFFIVVVFVMSCCVDGQDVIPSQKCEFSDFSVHYYNARDRYKLKSNFMPIFIENKVPEFIQMNVTVQNKTEEFWASYFHCPDDCMVFVGVHHLEDSSVAKVRVDARVTRKEVQTCEFDLYLSNDHLVPIIPQSIFAYNSHSHGIDSVEWSVNGSFSDKHVGLNTNRDPAYNSLGCTFESEMNIESPWNQFLDETLVKEAAVTAQMYELKYTNSICDGGKKIFGLGIGSNIYADRRSYDGCGSEVTDIRLSVEATNATQQLFDIICKWDILIDCEPSCGILADPVMILIIILVFISFILFFIILIVCLSTKKQYTNLA